MRLRNIAAGFGLALSVAALGCAPPAPEPSESLGKKFDAVTLFRAVYFREGPAANVVKKWDLPRKDAVAARMKEPPPEILADELRDVAEQFRRDGLRATATKLRLLADDIEHDQLAAGSAATQNADASKRLLINRIKKSDPKFFARFRKDIQSGNHVRVDRVFREGIARLVAVATSSVPTSTPHEPSFGGDYDDYSGFEGGGYDDGYDNGGYDDGYDNGGYDDGYDNGGYDNGGYDDGYDNGGYDNGGYDDGYDNGGNGNGNGGYDDGAGGNGGTGDGNGNGESGTGDDGSGADGTGGGQAGDSDTGAVGDQASLHLNISVFHDTVAASDKVAIAFAIYFVGAKDDGSLQTASFVDHLTSSFEDR